MSFVRLGKVGVIGNNGPTPILSTLALFSSPSLSAELHEEELSTGNVGNWVWIEDWVKSGSVGGGGWRGNELGFIMTFLTSVTCKKD